MAIDTDDNQETGGEWGELGVMSRAGWDEIAYFDRGDTRTNVIPGSMPLPDGTAGDPGRHRDARTGQVMNVALRPRTPG